MFNNRKNQRIVAGVICGILVIAMVVSLFAGM